MNELESRFVDQWCALFGQFIRAHLDSRHGGPLDCLQERLGDMADIATAEVHRAFIREMLGRIAEAAPEVSRRIEARILARRPLAATLFFGEEERGNPMGGLSFKARFIDGWCEIFARLLDAQLNGAAQQVVEKLRRRFQNLVEVGGEEVT